MDEQHEISNDTFDPEKDKEEMRKVADNIDNVIIKTKKDTKEFQKKVKYEKDGYRKKIKEIKETPKIERQIPDQIRFDQIIESHEKVRFSLFFINPKTNLQTVFQIFATHHH